MDCGQGGWPLLPIQQPIGEFHIAHSGTSPEDLLRDTREPSGMNEVRETNAVDLPAARNDDTMGSS